jgi:hypothetical protein
MGRTNWGPIIVGGVALVGIGYAYFNWSKICSHFGEGACDWFKDAGAIGDKIEGIFTSDERYMSDKAPATSRINTNPNAQKNAATAIANQQKFRSPAVIQKSSYVKPANTTARKNDFCSQGNNKTNYPNICGFYTSADFNSFNTITLNRISVR